MAPRPKAEPLPSPPQHARTSLSGATFCHCHGVFLCCPHVYCLVRSHRSLWCRWGLIRRQLAAWRTHHHRDSHKRKTERDREIRT